MLQPLPLMSFISPFKLAYRKSVRCSQFFDLSTHFASSYHLGHSLTYLDSGRYLSPFLLNRSTWTCLFVFWLILSILMGSAARDLMGWRYASSFKITSFRVSWISPRFCVISLIKCDGQNASLRCTNQGKALAKFAGWTANTVLDTIEEQLIVELKHDKESVSETMTLSEPKYEIKNDPYHEATLVYSGLLVLWSKLSRNLKLLRTKCQHSIFVE